MSQEYLAEGIRIELESFTFSTALPKIDNVDAFWAMQEGQATLMARVSLSSSMSNSELEKMLRINSGNQSLNHSSKANVTSRNHEIQIEGTESLKALSKLQFSFDYDSGQDSEASGSSKIFETYLPNKKELSLEDYVPSHDGSEGILSIAANQEISSKNIDQFISIEPKIAFQVSNTGNSIKISSAEFSLENTYELRIDKSLAGIFGGLREDYVQSVSFGKVKPALSFVEQKAIYLGSEGNRNILIRSVKVPQLKMEVYKIFENNITAFLSRGKQWDYSYDSEWSSQEYRSYDIANHGKLVYEERIETKELDRQDNALVLNMSFKDKFDNMDGLYVLKISGDDKKWLQDSRVLAISDIGLIAKTGKNNTYVFANSLKNASPISGCEVHFISNSNQKICSASTNSDGLAVFDKGEEWQDFETGLIIAENGGDYNFMKLRSMAVNTSRFETGGKRLSDNGYDLYLFGERDIYRPGEKVNIAGILRDEQMAPIADMPIKVIFTLPNGKVLQTVKRLLNDQGAFDVRLDLPEAAVTGNYRAKVKTANDVALGSWRFAVEEFMPDRIKVDIDLDGEFYDMQDSLGVELTAMNLFGPPAANRNYEVNVELRPDHFQSKDFPDYIFYNSRRRNEERKAKNYETLGSTDENGKAFYDLPFEKYWQNTGLVRGRVLATVFDETGRPVNQYKTFKLFTQDTFFGIGPMDGYVSTSVPLKFNFVSTDSEGKIKKRTKARVEILKQRWRSVMERSSSGYYSYRSKRVDELQESRELSFDDGQAQLSFNPQRSGSYLVRIYTGDSENYVERRFYAYGRGQTESTAFEVNREGKIDITLDKETYQPGDQARVLFKTPFRGRMLVTIEQDEVSEYHYMNTDEKSAEFSFTVTDAHTPNVYISATLFRPHVENSLPLMVAHGVGNLNVKNPGNEMDLELIVNEESRSGRSQQVEVIAEPNTQYVVAVVDEGILQLTNYDSPNPYNHFYQKRALAVSSSDLYEYLFPEISRNDALPGGGGYGLEKRANPMGSKRVKLVRHWSGLQKTDVSGKGQVSFDIPHFSGNLRVMAVAFKENKMAAAESNMIVSDPIVISTGLPRFVSPGDEISIPVTLSNTEDTKANGRVRVTAEAPLRIIGDAYQDIAIDPNKEAQIFFTAVADREIGEASVQVDIDAFGESFQEKIELNVRPASGLQKKSDDGVIKPGGQLTFNWSDDLMKNSFDGQLLLSRSPLMQFAGKLNELVRYPHGCMEQTISKAFPQLYYYDLFESLFPDKNAGSNAHENVKEAIYKIHNRRISSGALSYWYSRPHWWSSVYGLHFLSEAMEQGYTVDTELVEGLETFLISKLSQKETRLYSYNRGKSKEIAPREAMYSLFVLALRGKPQLSTMNYYKARTELLSLDSKYLLAAAYALSGDRKKFDELLPESFEGEISERMMANSFSSPIRDMALALFCLQKAEPENQQIPNLTKMLSTEMANKRYMNTQEMAFGFMALGSVLKESDGSIATAVVKSSKEVLLNYNGKSDVSLNYDTFGEDNFTVDATGDAPVYYYIFREGLSEKTEMADREKNLKIRKQFYNREGKTIDLDNIQQNQLIVVELSLSTNYSRSVDNVVISDLLPAGFEVENPRLSDLPDLPWLKKKSIPDHFDVRDDRIHMYVNASNNVRKYYYMVRAVSKGTFIMGAASADAMYDGDFYSYNGAREITIK